jgi:hypothetical protein
VPEPMTLVLMRTGVGRSSCGNGIDDDGICGLSEPRKETRRSLKMRTQPRSRGSARGSSQRRVLERERYSPPPL